MIFTPGNSGSHSIAVTANGVRLITLYLLLSTSQLCSSPAPSSPTLQVLLLAKHEERLSDKEMSSQWGGDKGDVWKPWVQTPTPDQGKKFELSVKPPEFVSGARNFRDKELDKLSREGGAALQLFAEQAL